MLVKLQQSIFFFLLFLNIKTDMIQKPWEMIKRQSREKRICFENFVKWFVKTKNNFMSHIVSPAGKSKKIFSFTIFLIFRMALNRATDLKVKRLLTCKNFSSAFLSLYAQFYRKPFVTVKFPQL